MKKVFLAVAFTVAGFVGVNAQKDFKFGAGVVAALPIGDAGDISNFAAGLELQGELGFSDKLKGVATTGYTHFFGKDLGFGTKIKFGAVPILVGVRGYLSENFFVTGQVGYGLFTGDADGGGFAYKPQVGYDAGKFQLALSYQGISDDVTISTLGLSGIIKF
ncbi:hypothetical protein LZZ85_23915 [Terrimonas sp. NA20]|uniref:Outer membrane protein beta-barrel domain-containing protein n=1 Tax=Terrimonas ginsenosidimutans TaxID=2908004 RepID=A0ABS9KYE4_9BACT|nr:hypothetical protein [Terrimonas ginsenosidimutans]MCG2617365.1 hypothetical protein [Terrimonas ginsenosidimutans]